MTCAGCGVDFRTSRWLMSKNKAGTYYCSRDCHVESVRRAPKVCEHCSESFTPTDSRGRYCSRKCLGDSRKNGPCTRLSWTRCLRCNEWVARPRRRHCTVCRDVLDEEYRRRNASRKRNTVCKDCAVPLPDQAWIRRCEPCRIALAKKMRQKHHRLAGCKNARQRARHHGVEYEYINRKKVFDRDKWRCGICGKKVDKRLKYPHPMSVSLDHIVPMSLGGGHLYVNVQCSHWLCNTEKCDTGAGDQLALLG